MLTVEDLVTILSNYPKQYLVTVQNWDEDGSTFFVPMDHVSVNHNTTSVTIL